MVDAEYMVSYSQILEILKYIPKEDYNKIPKNMIELFEKNCDKQSNFKYDPNKTLQQQNVNSTTKSIIAMLFRDYWATNETRKKIINFQQQERLKQKDIKEYSNNQINTNENLPTVIQKDGLFAKIRSIFSKIFGKK